MILFDAGAHKTWRRREGLAGVSGGRSTRLRLGHPSRMSVEASGGDMTNVINVEIGVVVVGVDVTVAIKICERGEKMIVVPIVGHRVFAIIICHNLDCKKTKNAIC